MDQKTLSNVACREISDEGQHQHETRLSGRRANMICTSYNGMVTSKQVGHTFYELAIKARSSVILKKIK